MMDKEVGYVTIDDVLSLDKSKSIAEILAEEYDRMIARDIIEVIKKYFPQATLDEKKVMRLARMILAEETEKGGAEETPKKHFTPEDVRKMTSADVRENYTAIINSMKEWN